jgi:hypothetical protein
MNTKPMKKQTFAMTYLTLSLLLFTTLANAAGTAVPEPFRGHDENSSFTLQYGDVDMILKTMVVDVGRSTREKAAETHAKTGTRMFPGSMLSWISVQQTDERSATSRR